MEINEILGIEKENSLYENKNTIIGVLSSLKKMTWDKAQSFLRGKVKEFFKKLESNGIDRKKVIAITNKHMWSNINNPNQLTSKKITESRLDESVFGDWWTEATGNLYGALSFYPLLTAFLEMDKVIKSSGDADVRSMSIYFLIWVAIISGKILKGKLVSKQKSSSSDNKVKASLHPSQVGR